MDFEQIKLSKFTTTYSKESITTTLHAELSDIKNGKYRSTIEQCRKLVDQNDREHYKIIKATLPVAAFGGVFNGGHKKENLVEYSRLVIIDIDDITQQSLTALKHNLCSNNFTLACWVSPSGRGIKLLIKVNTSYNEHRVAFKTISDYLLDTYGVVVDNSGSDYSRLCYASYDDSLFLNTGSQVFNVDMNNMDQLKEGKKIIAKSNITLPQFSDNERISLFSTEGRNKSTDRDKIWKLIQFLQKKQKSITSDYDSWLKVALAISNTFTYEVGLKYFLLLSKQDSHYNERECSLFLEYCYRNRRPKQVNLGTIFHIAELQGFSMSNGKIGAV